MSGRKLASQIILEEKLLCGGEWKSRKEIFDELLAEGFERRYVDYFLFCLAEHQPVEVAQDNLSVQESKEGGAAEWHNISSSD